MLATLQQLEPVNSGVFVTVLCHTRQLVKCVSDVHIHTFYGRTPIPELLCDKNLSSTATFNTIQLPLHNNPTPLPIVEDALFFTFAKVKLVNSDTGLDNYDWGWCK
ncbi:hypothetical protein BKA82DRAFT_31287 [Pisolithus tinctorius]|uniref:Uncharacterized protein n=1 Tax=Pisolithus tinctorius Marx 270 TaxID=870435 RepID=A0A0C3NT73_PISTI|nr:hypothetical protein BKA82DRAFT_31287 [Pisolithus tinctorius]KIN98433.1 hypothetical protein M404DRAFT_31287 [Pisolithus tinctorius Marx 270]